MRSRCASHCAPLIRRPPSALYRFPPRAGCDAIQSCQDRQRTAGWSLFPRTAGTLWAARKESVESVLGRGDLVSRSPAGTRVSRDGLYFSLVRRALGWVGEWVGGEGRRGGAYCSEWFIPWMSPTMMRRPPSSVPSRLSCSSSTI